MNNPTIRTLTLQLKADGSIKIDHYEPEFPEQQDTMLIATGSSNEYAESARKLFSRFKLK
ncbi:MAG TPA: hypothetical protein VNX68_07980 [Nitrosopumilaceae archaeon]|nr:hypothetical protein [Nitrosopumilaceae archaeon]